MHNAPVTIAENRFIFTSLNSVINHIIMVIDLIIDFSNRGYVYSFRIIVGNIIFKNKYQRKLETL